MKRVSIVDIILYNIWGLIPDKAEFRDYLNRIKNEEDAKLDKMLISRSLEVYKF